MRTGESWISDSYSIAQTWIRILKGPEAWVIRNVTESTAAVLITCIWEILIQIIVKIDKIILVVHHLQMFENSFLRLRLNVTKT